MKSMLQEASSVLNAIEKAWDQAGKPREFTIKILEEGKKGFLGLTGEPAIVSITYHPIREIKRTIIREREDKKDFSKKPKKTYMPVSPAKKEQKAAGILDSLFGKKEETQKPQKYTEKPGQPPAIHRDRGELWNKGLVDDVSTWLKEIMNIMEVEVAVNFKQDQKILNILIDKRIFKDSEEEKLFFIGLSHLLMQFLKRKYKRKFANYYLIIHSKLSENDENRKSTTSDK